VLGRGRLGRHVTYNKGNREEREGGEKEKDISLPCMFYGLSVLLREEGEGERDGVAIHVIDPGGGREKDA